MPCNPLHTEWYWKHYYPAPEDPPKPVRQSVMRGGHMIPEAEEIILAHGKELDAWERICQSNLAHRMAYNRIHQEIALAYADEAKRDENVTKLGIDPRSANQRMCVAKR